jgi:hypothetical protein
LAGAARAADDPPRWRIWKQGNFGYIDASGAEVIEAQYARATPFAQGRACVEKDGRAFFIDSAGKRVGKLKFLACRGFSEGLARVVLGGDVIAFVKLDGKLAMKPAFKKVKAEDAGDFHDGLAPVRVGAKWGYIDAKGAWVVEPTYGPDLDFKAWKKKLKKLEKKQPEEYQRELAAVDFDAARDFSEGLAAVKVGGKWGWIDTTGKLVIEARFEPSGDARFREGLVVVSDGGKLGYLDKNGGWAVAPAFSSASEFSDGLAAVVRDGAWEYVDKDGKTAIALDASTQSALPFSEGLAAVWMTHDGMKKRGYIDKTGKIAITPEYDIAAPFDRGLAEVSKNPTSAWIDRTGKPIWIAPDHAGAWKKK